MNEPQKKSTPREELEMRLTALLMGELPPEEAVALEAQVAADPALAGQQERLRKAMELVREASKEPEAPVSETPVQLSSERRARLLAHFQTSRPKPPKTVKLARFPHPVPGEEKTKRDWSWVIPLGVAATVVGLVAYGLGGTVLTKSATDAPDFSASSTATSAMVSPNPEGKPADLADQEGLSHTYKLEPMAPSVNFNAVTITSGATLSATTNGVTTPSFQIAAMSTPTTAMSRGLLSATPAPAAPVAAPARRQIATGTASPVAHAMNPGYADAAAVASTTAVPALVPDSSTIYLGKTMANTGTAVSDETKWGFATAGSADVAITKSGSGTVILNGANSFSGSTSISGGTLSLHSNFDAGVGGSITGVDRAGAPAYAGSFWDSPRSATTDSGTLNMGKDVFIGGGTLAKGKAIDGLEFKAGQSALLGREKEVAQASSWSELKLAEQRRGGAQIADNTRVPKEVQMLTEEPAQRQVDGLQEMTARDAAKPVAGNKTAAAKATEIKAKAKAPEERAALVEKAKSEQRDYYNKTIDPKFKTTVEQVKQWSVEAQELYDTGRFALAKKRSEQILNVDPTNIGARRFEEKIDRAMSDYGIAAYNETRADAIPKANLAWARPIRRFADPNKDGFANEDEWRSATDPNKGDSSKQTAALRKKLERTIIPRIEFRDTTVREALDFLKKKSVELDDASPAGEKGMNIVLKSADAAGKDVPGIPGLQTPTPAGSPAALDETDPANARITVSLKDIPLGEALKYVTGLANLKYKVEPHAIAVTPITENTDVFITKEWKVPVDLIPGASATTATADREVAKNWLIAQGLQFNGAAAAVYIPKNNRLVVRNTQDQLDLVDTIVETKTAEKAEAAARAAAPAVPVPQPEVETRANPFSTFSLNVSDVSFKLAAASLEQNHMPDPATVRSEEFINAFDYRDPEPAPGAPLAFATERARYPFAQNRDLLRFSVKTAAAGRQPGRPLNIVLLLDNSGSMERADRVNIVREALRVLATQLQPEDKLSIVTFARTPRLWADGVAGDKVADTIARVSEITPEGGTNLEAALDLGYATALKHYTVGSINRVVLFTDGAANLGDVDPEALTKKVEAQRKKGVALDCFGIGWEGFNDDLLEQLTRNADGRYGFINTPEEAAENFASQLAGALRVAASDVKVQVEFNPRRVKAYRQVGYAKHQLTKEQFRDNTVNAAQIGAAESGNALYVVEVDPRGEGDLATVRVRFRDPGSSDYHEHEWAVPFTGDAAPLEQASSALRLAGAASAFSEMLANNPFAAEVTSDRLLNILSGVPPIYGADPRPTKLEWMIRQARSLSNR